MTLEARPFSVEKLQNIIERLERLHNERDNINEDIKAVMSEAVGLGLEKKAIREVLKIRKMDRGDLAALDELMSMYRQALSI